MGLKPRVGLSVSRYLSITANWIYKQLTNLNRFEPIVIAGSRINSDMFPLKHIYCLNDLTGVKAYVRRALNKFSRSKTDYYYHTYILKKMNILLLHSHFGNRGFSDLEITRRLRIPHITTFYGYDVSMLPRQNPIWKERYAQLFDECDLFLVEGNHMKSCLVALGCSASKLIVHHIGVDLSEIEFSSRRIGTDGEITVLAAATFTEKKGIPYAIEAFALLKSRRPDLNLRFTLIGDVPNPAAPRLVSARDAVFRVIEKYGIWHCVRLLGYVPHHQFIEEAGKAHIFISPSIAASDGDTEGGSPVSIIEMSASGLPILSTFHCDIPEVVIDGETGFLVPERDVEALADRLEYLVAHPELWEEMARKGRLHVEHEYNLSKQVRRLENIYSTLCS